MAETVLLMGLPNVGKSVIFNRLTGLNVRAANYCGTTVQYTAGKLILDNKEFNLVDVPGTYSLQATNEAEAVAVDMLQGGTSEMFEKVSHCEHYPCPASFLQKPTAVICVVDAANMEASIYLLLQVLQKGIPAIVALNRSDLAREKGHCIDAITLSRELELPVVPTVAVSGEGMNVLKEKLTAIIQNQSLPTCPQNDEVTWKEVENICQQIWQKDTSAPPNRREKWGDLLTRPWPGLPLAILIIALVFGVVVGVGLLLRQQILLPFFRSLVFPYIELIVTQAIPPGIIREIFIGEYGFLIKGIEWPFALVLPYIISFYAALSFLEDSGYLPRLGVLLDGLLNRIGLQGSGIIPLILGYGCAIPAILATRTLNSSKEKIITTTMICLAIPCIAQTGAFIALLSARSIPVMLAVFLLGILVMITAAIILNRKLEGYPPEMLMEIPELLLPRLDVLFKKVWLRIKHFMVDGALPLVLGVALAALLYETGIMKLIGSIMQPLVVNWLGLPADAAIPLILGILRRELIVLPLLDMELSTLQLFVGATVGLFYVPCIAVLASLIREFNLKMAGSILLFTSVGAFLIGGIIYQLGSLFFS